MAEEPPPQLSQDRRAHARQQVQVPVKAVFGKNNTAIDAVIVDRSFKGMRLRLPPGQTVPNDFILLEPGAGQVHEVRSAWKAYPDVGLSVQRSYPIAAAAGPAGLQLQRLWRETISR
jgi:hypothetical protein